jgi:hypothetical protein
LLRVDQRGGRGANRASITGVFADGGGSSVPVTFTR